MSSDEGDYGNPSGFIYFLIRPGGGMGIRGGLKIRWPERAMWVRVPPGLLGKKTKETYSKFFQGLDF